MKTTLVLLGTMTLLLSTGCVQRERTLVGSRAAGDAALRDGEYALAADAKKDRWMPIDRLALEDPATPP